MNVKLLKIKQLLIEWSCSSSCYYSHVFRANKIVIKVIWTVAFIVTLAVCSFFISGSLMEFFTFETTSKIELKSEPYIEMPAITICLTNLFLTDKAKSFAWRYLDSLSGQNEKNATKLEQLYNFKNLSHLSKMWDDLASMYYEINRPEFNETYKKVN